MSDQKVRRTFPASLYSAADFPLPLQSNRDYLSHLPSELLEEIFHHAHDSSLPLTVPLSKSLLPFQRRQLFRSIEVHSYESLDNLCTIARSDCKIPTYARQFRFEVDYDKAADPIAQESEDLGSPSNSAVERFFRQTSNLQTIETNGSTRISLLLLSPPVMSSFRRLESLDISSTLHSLPDPFSPSHYSGLQSCSTLHSLSLTILRNSPSIENSARTELDSKPFANIRQLQLIGTLSSNEPSVRRFFSSFDSLSTLSLFDTSYTSSLIQKLLEALPAPHHLDILNFGCRPRLDTSNRGDLARCFKSFTRLRALTLLSDFSSFTSDLYSDLRVLPIEILQFASKACVSIDRLTSLISGPTKHSTLKSIGLNQIKGRIGTSIRDVGEPYWDDLVSEWRPYPDWELPMWTEAFDEERLVEFLAIAKKQGLIVGGSAVDAIGVLAEREEEWRLLEGFVPERDESD